MATKTLQKELENRVWTGRYEARFNKEYHRIADRNYRLADFFASLGTVASAMLSGAAVQNFLRDEPLGLTAWGLTFFGLIFLVLRFSDKQRYHHYLYRRWNGLDIEWKELEQIAEREEKDINVLRQRMDYLETEAIRIDGEQVAAFLPLLRHAENLVRRQTNVPDLLPLFKFSPRENSQITA